MSEDFEKELREYDKRTEEKAQAVFNWFKNQIALFIGIGIVIFWIFYGTVAIIPTKMELKDRIGLTICTIGLAVLYCGLISSGGFASAKKTQEFKNAENDNERAMKRGNGKKRQIQYYAIDVATKNLEDNRRNNLEANGLVYEDIFDENGELKAKNYQRNRYHKKKNPNGYTKKQIKIISKCSKQKIIIPTIFGMISSKYFGLKKETTEKDYVRKNTTINTVSRIVLSTASVGFMFEFLGFSIASMIYALFQIVLWTASGFLQRMKNFNFVIDNTIPQMKERTLIIDGYMEMSDKEKEKYENLVLKEIDANGKNNK